MIAPILPHTADEVWAFIDDAAEKSVQLTDMPSVETYENAQAIEEKWDRFMDLRDDVLKALEEARMQK